MPAVLLFLLAMMIYLQFRLWIGEGGRHAVAELEAQVEQQVQDNASRQQRNDALVAEVADLKNLSSGGAAVEERARSELGMIKPGEVFYRVVEPDGVPARMADPATPQRDEPVQ
nr:cell division protein FtsB [Lysobacter chinensis]